MTLDFISIYFLKRGVWGGEASPRSPFARRNTGGYAARVAASEQESSFGGPTALQTSQIGMPTVCWRFINRDRRCSIRKGGFGETTSPQRYFFSARRGRSPRLA